MASDKIALLSKGELQEHAARLERRVKATRTRSQAFVDAVSSQKNHAVVGAVLAGTVSSLEVVSESKIGPIPAQVVVTALSTAAYMTSRPDQGHYGISSGAALASIGISVSRAAPMVSDLLFGRR